MSEGHAPSIGLGQIGFEQIGIGSVLRRYRLQVPLNQREYRWTTRQVTQLFQDFAKAISEEGSEHFLGTIVTVPLAPDVVEVVDGQQRLATTAIFLSEIRNYVRDSDPLIAQDIENGLLTDIDRAKREHVPKLKLNVDDNEFFRSWLMNEKHRPVAKPLTSHELIANAFDEASKQVTKIVAPFSAQQRGNELNRWITFVEHGAQVILLKVPTRKRTYRMFETLNDRGLRTTQADLIKSFLLETAGESRLVEAQQKWAFMRGSLESLEEEEIVITFLRQALIIVRGYLTAADVYDAVQQQVRGPQGAIELLAHFESLANTYVAILNSESEKWNTYPDAMRRAVQALDRLNLRVLRPVMLAVASKFSPQQTTDAFQAFISWAVRLLVASGTRSESIIEPIATAAHKVYTGKINDLKRLKQELLEVIPTDEQFRMAFETATVSKSALARYYLRSLEMAAKGESTPWFLPLDDKEVINLEHVLPEKPMDNWPKVDENTVRLYAKRIGNLALLQAKRNSDLRSTDFKTKKAVYKETPYVLTSDIAKLPGWDASAIEKRQKVLADFALKAWPL